MANPTTPGMHHHLCPTDDRPVIEGIRIELGSGNLGTEWQLAERVLHIWRSDGGPVARNLILRLLENPNVNRERLKHELVLRNLMKKED